MSDFPAHYTPADVALIRDIESWCATRNYSQAALARLARVKAPTLNQIINGKYVTSPTKHLAQVQSAMTHADDAAANVIAPVETSVYRLAFSACQMARRYRNFAVLAGSVGIGKTFALKHYAATHPNTYLIEATPTMTPSSLMKLLARTLIGDEGRGSPEDRFRRVLDAIRATDTLLIIDEAETLTARQLHTIRRLRDLGGIGCVLSGTKHLGGLIRPEEGQFDQIRSRTGFWPQSIERISEDDAAALAQAGFGAEDVPDDVVSRLFAYSKGSARMLVEGLISGIREYRKNRPLTVSLVDAVAKQALCLNPLA